MDRIKVHRLVEYVKSCGEFPFECDEVVEDLDEVLSFYGIHVGLTAYERLVVMDELLDMAEAEIFALSQAFLHRDFVALRDVLATSFERLETLIKSGSEIRGVPTGFQGLDKKLSGMQDSNLLILAARPGVGKTTFALNMAMHIGLKEKIPVGFFSLEMSCRSRCPT